MSGQPEQKQQTRLPTTVKKRYPGAAQAGKVFFRFFYLAARRVRHDPPSPASESWLFHRRATLADTWDNPAIRKRNLTPLPAPTDASADTKITRCEQHQKMCHSFGPFLHNVADEQAAKTEKNEGPGGSRGRKTLENGKKTSQKR